MNKLLGQLILICFFLPVSGQIKIEAFVKSSAIPVSTVEPDSTDFTEFEKIGDAIGNARVVMLGEQDHGDAPTFLAKTRLIKYLHEKKGFNVLAFESDFFALNEGWDKLAKTKTSMDTFIRRNIFPIWTYCNTCSNLFYNYIPGTWSTPNPVIVAGFDNQMILQYSSKNLAHKLDSMITALQLPVANDPDYSTLIIPSIDSIWRGYLKKPSADFQARCTNYLQTIRQQAAEKLSKDNFWLLVIDNLICENEEYNAPGSRSIEARNTRDLQMALNLQWLYEIKYAKEKIIVWAANGHIAKYGDGTGGNNKMTVMGSHFTSDAQRIKDTYVIGFTSYKGTAGRLGMNTYSIKEPKSGGFENWIDKSYNYSFVDFSAYNKLYPGNKQSFFLKGLGHQSFFQYDWTKVFDGVFFIRYMYPCAR